MSQISVLTVNVCFGHGSGFPQNAAKTWFCGRPCFSEVANHSADGVTGYSTGQNDTPEVGHCIRYPPYGVLFWLAQSVLVYHT